MLHIYNISILGTVHIHEDTSGPCPSLEFEAHRQDSGYNKLCSECSDHNVA